MTPPASASVLPRPLGRAPGTVIPGLRCILCRSPELTFGPDLISCDRCGQECPVLGGVPVLFEAVSVQQGPSVDAAGVGQILAAFGLPDDPLTRLRVRAMTRLQVRFGGSLIEVESRQFLDRVRHTGFTVDATPVAAGPVRHSPDLAVAPRYGWPKSYMPRRMQAGARLLANMRLSNTGSVPLPRDGIGRITVSQAWRRRDGGPADGPDLRTPLPIDLHPGQSVTLAVMLAIPAQPGAYALTLTLIQEQVRQLDADAITLPVTVLPEVAGSVPAAWTVLEQPPASYDADHLRGRSLLAGWLASHLPGSTGRPKVLEVGGNATPMGAGLEVELVNVDVDLLGLQVGRISTRQRGLAVQHLCADAFDLPFPPGHFDAIVIFASLHHFPDPAALLQHLRRHLRQGGFLGLFCEPVGHIWPGAIDPLFLAELEKGVNEQSFSLREYELMFRQAELDAVEVIVDHNSLKARLMPMAADPGGA